MNDFIFEKIDCVDSTNDYLKRELEEGKLNRDKILIARYQTNGHGSNGRSFISDKNVGIYFTILHFYKEDKEIKFITQKAAVAVYNTFKEIFGIELAIKWVNDLYYNDKKIAGILCKNLIKHNAVMIGIGIDLFENSHIDDSIRDIAGYIFRDKSDLINVISDNKLLSKNSKLYKSIYIDFNNEDTSLWEPDTLVLEISKNIYSLLNAEGLPQIYIEKNIIKDKKIYEDYNLEC